MKRQKSEQSPNISRTAVATAVAAALTAPAVGAQDNDPLVIDEVIVTATKRESSVQDLAVAVTAIDGGQIADLQLINVLDLDKAVPGLKIRYVGSDPSIIVRGAGAAGTNDIAVPIYVDGIYRPKNGQALASNLDLERIEVLRGPQGTLFGRNTFGGLVHYITKKPSMEAFDYGVSGTFGDYSLQKFQGFVNVPMGDMFALRVSASDTQRDPLIENDYNKRAGLRDEDNTYARAQLRFEPTDAFNATLTATWWEDTSNGNGDFAGVLLGIPVNSAGLTDGIDGTLQPRAGRLPGDEDVRWPAAGGRSWAGTFGVDASASTNPDPHKISIDLEPVRDVSETSINLNANYDFGAATLTVNYAQFDYSERRLADSDYSPNATQFGIDNPVIPDPAFGPGVNTENYFGWCFFGPSCGIAAGVRHQSKAHQADVNLNSNGDGPLQWTLGYFLFDDSDVGDNVYEFVWAHIDSDTSSPYHMSWAHWLSQSNGGTRSTAIYGQAEYSFTDRTRATLGLRRSTDKRNSFTKYIDYGYNVHGFAAGYADAHLEDPGSRFDDWPTFVETPSSPGAKGSKDNTDYKVAIQHDLTDNAMLYGSISTGYIAGGIEGGSSGSQNLTAPNEVESIEVGIKSTLLDGTMRLNVAAYNNDYEGLSTSSFEACGSTICAVSVVSGSMTATGLEVELDWIATDALRIRAGLALQDAELDKFGRSVLNRVFRDGGDQVSLAGGATTEAECDERCSQVYVLDGQKARFSPDWTLSVDASYRFELGDAGTITPGVFIYSSADYKTTNIPYFFTKQDSYTTYDLRATWESANHPFAVRAFMLNAGDELVQIGSDQFSQGRVIADFNNPRTWGLTLSYNF
ncbi:MAG: TonB-dependent receptor [Gammaproteobacteria bacterium]|nr:TonB-dependent receptor [Gammaproteobacteria bacterium]